MSEDSKDKSINCYDPNPLVLFNVFSAILMNITGVLSRSLALLEKPDGKIPDTKDGINLFYGALTSTRHLLLGHISILCETCTDLKAIYPIGVETLWMHSHQQVDDYLKIRDQTIRLFLESTLLSIHTPFFALEGKNTDEISKALNIIRSVLYQTIDSATFDDYSTLLVQGFDAAITFLGEIRG
jgi:hypothetical protein